VIEPARYRAGQRGPGRAADGRADRHFRRVVRVDEHDALAGGAAGQDLRRARPRLLAAGVELYSNILLVLLSDTAITAKFVAADKKIHSRCTPDCAAGQSPSFYSPEHLRMSPTSAGHASAGTDPPRDV